MAFRRLRRAPHVLVAYLHVQIIRILHVKAVLILARIQAVSFERCRKRIGIIVVDAEHEVRYAGLLAVAQDQAGIAKDEGGGLVTLHRDRQAEYVPVEFRGSFHIPDVHCDMVHADRFDRGGGRGRSCGSGCE